MASGDSILESFAPSAPAATAATPDLRVGASTPGESIQVLDFDDTTIEYYDFLCRAHRNASLGGGITVKLPFSATSATTGNAQLGAAIRRVADDAEDIDVSHTYDFNDIDDAAPTVSGEVTDATITFTSGTDMDNLAAGNLFILRVRRNASHANDTMVGDAELWFNNIAVRET